MNSDDYLKTRLEQQITWYSREAFAAKRRYLSFCAANLLGSASIPFLSGYVTDDHRARMIVGLVGVGLSVIAGALTLFKWQENWIQFRSASEALKHEKYLFYASCPPYDGPDRVKILAQRVEGMISRENSNWTQYIKQTDQSDDRKKDADK